MHVQANDFAGHNSSLFVLGVMILWFGWYGFNPGSQLVIVGGTNSFAVSVSAVTTTLAPAAAGLSSLLTKALETHFSTGAPSMCHFTFGVFVHMARFPLPTCVS